MVFLIIYWILVESSVSPPACPILRELESAVCNLQSRTATRGEGWAWCVRGCRAHHATIWIMYHPFSHSSEGDHQQARAEDGQQGGRGGLPVRHLPTQPLARPGLRARRRYAEKISCGMRKYLLSVHADSCGLAGGTPWGGNVPEWGEYVNTTNARSDTWQ